MITIEDVFDYSRNEIIKSINYNLGIRELRLVLILKLKQYDLLDDGNITNLSQFWSSLVNNDTYDKLMLNMIFELDFNTLLSLINNKHINNLFLNSLFIYELINKIKSESPVNELLVNSGDITNYKDFLLWTEINYINNNDLGLSIKSVVEYNNVKILNKILKILKIPLMWQTKSIFSAPPPMYLVVGLMK